MIRKIIHIEEKRCNGCGICAAACHEGAIEIVEGKARLAREHFCDGLGDCLPACPAGAITFEEREAPAYDEAAVQQAKQDAERKKLKQETGRSKWKNPEQAAAQVRNWPVQIKLAPLQAPYFQGARLLIAADCTAYAYASFHQEFIKDRITLIGCPKLDDCDYAEKLTEIIKNNDIHSIKIVRMEVPCCGGLENAVIRAMQNSGKMIPWQVVVITCDGEATTMP